MITAILLGFYFVGLTFIFLFSLGQLHLSWHYQKARKSPVSEKEHDFKFDEAPKVTIQLPVYNEKYVVERLIKKVSEIRYPEKKLEIQILDDSTDETIQIIDNILKELADDRIKHIRRGTREGFKAGALAYGMTISDGDFFGIFDADFLPEPDFLEKTMPWFDDEKIGVVQARWGHINKEYSLLTRLQAFGLDAHFTIEQGGRSHAGSFINFNGTAGVWRRACIADAGGWSQDTLTEDLDLSYRAQMKGWKFNYLEDVVAPAELPIVMDAIKSQQYRWNKGAAETARKHLGEILRSELPLKNKFHAAFHLLNSSVFLFLLVASIISVPLLWLKYLNPHLNWVFNLGIVFLVGFMAIVVFYWNAWKRLNPEAPLWKFLVIFPTFLAMSMGLSLHNAVAVSEGFLKIKTPFIRTPKFNVINKSDLWANNIYLKAKLTKGVFVEGLLSLYFLGAIFLGIYINDIGLIFFHTMLFLGFSAVFYQSVRPIKLTPDKF